MFQQKIKKKQNSQKNNILCTFIDFLCYFCGRYSTKIHSKDFISFNYNQIF